MQESSHIKRVGKSLLVAALGVATVSFVGASGCALEGADGDDGDVDAPVEDEVETAPRAATQALNVTTNVSAAATQVGTTIVVGPTLPPSGNLMPPHEWVIPDKLKGFKPIPPSGNLMATPPIEELRQIAGGN